MSLANKLAEERRARLAAERLLEQKQAELHAANRKLGKHAIALSEEIVETRAEVKTVRDENARVRSDLSVANEKIQIAERRLWHSIETIQDGFAFFDTDNRMIAANDAWLSVFDGLEAVRPGVSYVELLQFATEEGIVNIGEMKPAEWREHMLDRWQSPAPEPEVIRLWSGAYIKLIDQRGHGGDVVCLALNITDTVRYEERLKLARQKAEAASRAKSAFLANMSHEIRTPMNGIVGMADLLMESKLSHEQKLFAETIKNSGEALLVIINDILDYSKIEAGKLALKEDKLDLERSIHELVTLMQANARDKGIDLLVDYDMFLPTLFVADAGRFRQVLTNLLGNAVKFTETGHVLVRVVGIPKKEDGTAEVHVTVHDTGIGISEDKAGHIFGEFNQVEDERNRKFEGTGLGLAITKKLVGMMGGKIWVESQLGEGSTFGFVVALPVAENIDPATLSVPDNLSKVLVVDNCEANALILRRQLDALGIGTQYCSTGARALKSLTDDVDLIVAEHNMPEMDGMELAAAIRDAGHLTPVILLSSNIGYAEQDPARRYVDAVLQKPVARQVLLAALNRLPGKTRPEKTQEQPRPDRPGESPSLASAAQPGRVMRVLAAEDNKTNRLVFSKMVKDYDIELVFAENGHEAVECYQSFTPDLIFMDISMPGMDGKEATAKIRQLEEKSGARVPIVAMTAHAMNGDREEIIAAGLNHYLTKPLRKAAIAEQIAAALPEGANGPFAGIQATA